MGISPSTDAEPTNEHFFGLVNFGNTCYVNSVLQALYFCKPFREKIIEYKLGYAQRTAHLSNSKDSSTTSTTDNTTNTPNGYVNGQTNNGTANYTTNNSSQINGYATMQNGTTTTTTTTTTTSNGSNSPNSITAAAGANVSILKQEHLLNCLAELFYSIANMKKKKGIVQPKKFIARLRKDNDAFDNLFQQDAHEFLNYLLNTCADILKEEMRELRKLEPDNYNMTSSNLALNHHHHNPHHQILNTHHLLHHTIDNHHQHPHHHNHHAYQNQSVQSSTTSSSSSKTSSSGGRHNRLLSGSTKQNGRVGSASRGAVAPSSSSSATSTPTNGSLKGADAFIGASAAAAVNQNKQNEQDKLTWIHELFQGILVNETKCLNCETSSSKEENFLDLSVDVEQNTSLSHCLQEFSNMEMLCGECKYYCETCRSKQEAEKRMRIKKLPKILALHLKRFKFVGMLNKFKKLTYRVVFPFELRLFNTTEDCENGDQIYDLVSFVVHCGMGLNRGHYISVVKSHGFWFLFDDEQVEKIEVSNFEEFYGLTQDTNKKSETSYILFYEARSTT